MTTLTQKQREFVEACRKDERFDGVISRPMALEIAEAAGLKAPQWLFADPQYRAGRGMYSLPSESVTHPVQAAPVASVEAPKAPTAAMAMVAHVPHATPGSLVPPEAVGYVPFGNFNDVYTILQSKKFYPIYVTGLSGNGKTMMCEQASCKAERECIRVNITEDTDEDDLLGGFRLVDGNTVWQDGPVVQAMKRGAVLILDEIDLGRSKLMCLQPVLEGRPIFLKKINTLVRPAEGFTVLATANTKGKGSDDGKFIGTNVMNEAMLDRFAATMEQEYPKTDVEVKILHNVLLVNGLEMDDWAELLVKWADIIRKTYQEDGVEDVISTRRLVSIADAYAIFKDKMKALTLCLNRFDDETKQTFMNLYTKVDMEARMPAKDGEEEQVAVAPDASGPKDGDTVPF